MMHNKQPYSFEKTDVRGRFLLKFSCTNVKLETVSPIAANVNIDATMQILPHYPDPQYLHKLKKGSSVKHIVDY